MGRALTSSQVHSVQHLAMDHLQFKYVKDLLSNQTVIVPSHEKSMRRVWVANFT